MFRVRALECEAWVFRELGLSAFKCSRPCAFEPASLKTKLLLGAFCSGTQHMLFHMFHEDFDSDGNALDLKYSIPSIGFGDLGID